MELFQGEWDRTWSAAEVQPWYPDEQVVRFLARYIAKKTGPARDEVSFFTTQEPPVGLDLGCGKGRHAIVFSQFGITAHGCDISPVAIAFARRWAEAQNLCVQFDVCAEKLPYDDEFFDFIVCHGVLDHILHAPRAALINEMKRVLKQGGLALCSLIGKHDGSFGQGKPVESDTWLIEEGNEREIPQAYFDPARIEKEFDGLQLLTLERMEFHSERGRSLIGSDKHHVVNSRYYVSFRK